MANLDILKQEGCDPKEHIWSRRNFLGLVGWSTVLGSLGIGTLAFGRFMYPRVLFEPRTTVKLGKPEEYIVNSVSEKWIKLYRLWLIRNPDGFVAQSAKCTHLGCTPRWLESENKFKCPCHGSGFRGLNYSPNNLFTGRNFEGPAPRPLERFYIALAEDGQILVDFGRVFRGERDEWIKAGAYLKYSG
ncbi:MAG TPA: Rieske 2Fe-2S domain-containing protein [Polyangia bacterium]|nr:Rieske 2Fe-2S domain-containing protein [Polyangia bacterium]